MALAACTSEGTGGAGSGAGGPGGTGGDASGAGGSGAGGSGASGSGGQGGSSTGGDCGAVPSCYVCADCATQDPCASQYGACANNPDCIDLYTCWGNCGPADQACVDSCEADYSGGMGEWVPLRACILQTCSSCSGG